MKTKIDPVLWILNKKKIYLNHPKPEDFDLSTIAIGLSRICRFANQTKIFYSVAYHSVLVADICPKELKLAGLMHDSCEFLLGDLPHDLKYIPELLKIYKPIEEKFMKAIAKRFSFDWTLKVKKEIKKLEKTVELAEIRDLIDLLEEDKPFDFTGAIQNKLDYEFSMKESEQMFIDKYWEIMNNKIPF